MVWTFLPAKCTTMICILSFSSCPSPILAIVMCLSVLSSGPCFFHPLFSCPPTPSEELQLSLPGTFIIWEHPAFELHLARFGGWGGGHDILLAFGHTAGDACAGSFCGAGAQSLQTPSQAPFLKRAIASVQGLSTFLKHSSYFFMWLVFQTAQNLEQT